MFFIVRIVLAAIVAAAIVFIRKRKNIKTNVIHVIALCFTLLLSSLILPLDKLIVFPTPEAAFRYYSFGQPVDVVYGNESASVVSAFGNGYNITVFPAKGDGYTIPHPYALRAQKAKKTTENITSLRFYSIKKDSDVYIYGFIITDHEAVSATNEQDTELHLIYDRSLPNNWYYLIHGLVEVKPDDYSFMINNERFYP